MAFTPHRLVYTGPHVSLHGLSVVRTAPCTCYAGRHVRRFGPLTLRRYLGRLQVAIRLQDGTPRTLLHVAEHHIVEQ